MEKWKTLASKYLYETPYGNLREDSCLLPNGFIIPNYHINEFSDWVNGVVITKDQKVIFVKQYRHGGGDFFIEVPAGTVEKEEDLLEAFKREVQEETGYGSLLEPILLGHFNVNPANQNNHITTYLMLDAELVSTQNLDPTEDIEVVIFSLDEVQERLKNNAFNHLFCVYALMLALNYLKTNK